jgi:anti-sigma-K factor RskA
VLGSEDVKPALVASVDRSGRYLTVKVLEQVLPTPGHALELWALPEGKEAHSLGAIPPSGFARIPLGAPAGILFQRIPKLGVSLEPRRGMHKPSGPMLYSGTVQMLY